ncbi:membrane protein [Gluconobacter cerinus]|uniref:Membrane protein n=2 Tax=Gluconobacter cerinus TaxID=38307 RepID=A0A1B6VJ02_9PROT|nr:membrane protein [Gluconobacter cerinus]
MPTYVSSGNTATGTVSDFQEILLSGATGQYQTVTDTGQIVVQDGALLMQQKGSSLWGVGNGGKILVYSGGTLVGGAITSGGVVLTTSGSILSGGFLISSGGVLSHWSSVSGGGTLVAGGVIYTQSGGSVDGITVASDANILVSAGGSADDIIVSGGGGIGVAGVASDTIVSSGGIIDVSSGGVASGTTVNGGSAYVEPGGTVSTTTIESGGAVYVSSGASAKGTTVDNFGNLVVSSGGNASNTVVSSGGGLGVQGTTSGTTVLNGGMVDIASGGVASGNTVIGGAIYAESGAVVSTTNIENGGIVYVSAGASAAGTTVDNFGNLVIYSGATASNTVVSSGGGLGVQGTTSGTTILNGGMVDITSGGIATGNTISSGGNVYAASGGTIGATAVQSGATLSAAAGAVISGTVTAAQGASVTISTTAGGTIDLQGNGNVGLTITGSGSPTTVISGFSEDKAAGTADSLTLTDVKAADVASVTYPDADHVTFTLKDGSAVTLNIIGVQNVGYTLASDASGDLVYEVCFLADTLIAGPNGNIAVQDLAPGDTVTSYRDGQAYSSTVSWAGKAHCVVRPEKADDEAGYPVRILENAIALGVPFQDMLVTSEHCLFLDGKFIPVRMLVNGRSIFYDKSFTSYDYFHIETEGHSVIMANGALTESYLDTGNRRAFEQKSNVFMFGQKAKSWENDAAAALTVCRDLVEPVYRQIEQRAQELQFAVQAPVATTVTKSNLHLVSDRGHRIQPLRTVDNRVMFMIPGDVSSVRIVSNSSRPADAIGPFVDDRRMLGVLIGDVSFFDSGVTVNIKTHLTKENLSGWHSVEHIPMRWTNGNAYLPLGARLPGGIGLLAIKVEAAGPYVVAPADDVEVGLKTA